MSTAIDQNMIMFNNIRVERQRIMRYKPPFLIFRRNFGSSTQVDGFIHNFTPLDVLIRVKAFIREEPSMTFDVCDDGRLTFTHTETNLFSFCLHKARVLANDGSNWVFRIQKR